MIGWIIFLVIVLILALLLISSVKISFHISDKVLFSVSYLGFSFFKFDSSLPKATEKKSSVTKKKEDKNESFTSFLKKYAASKKKSDLVKELFEIIKIILLRFKKLIGKIRFKNFSLDLTVASEDAAKTAILYGEICSVVYPVLSMLSSCLHFFLKSISVRTDFTSDEIKIKLSSVIKIRICSLLSFALSTAFSIIKLKLGDLKNG